MRQAHLKMAVARGVMYAGAAALALANDATPCATAVAERGGGSDGAREEPAAPSSRADEEGEAVVDDELSGALAELRRAQAAVSVSSKAVEAALRAHHDAAPARANGGDPPPQQPHSWESAGGGTPPECRDDPARIMKQR